MRDKKFHFAVFLALRISLAIVFLWFGLLKLFNVSPVLEIIAQAYPIIADNKTLYFILALSEVAIGIGIVIPRISTIASLVMIGHLMIATVGVLVSPQAFSSTFPLLSVAGEFVVKNFVLIFAALVLVQHDAELKAASRSAP